LGFLVCLVHFRDFRSRKCFQCSISQHKSPLAAEFSFVVASIPLPNSQQLQILFVEMAAAKEKEGAWL
jgi:hypothetical protein